MTTWKEYPLRNSIQRKSRRRWRAHGIGVKRVVPMDCQSIRIRSRPINRAWSRCRAHRFWMVRVILKKMNGTLTKGANASTENWTRDQLLWHVTVHHVTIHFIMYDNNIQESKELVDLYECEICKSKDGVTNDDTRRLLSYNSSLTAAPFSQSDSDNWDK